MVSLVIWAMLTWSFGLTGFLSSSSATPRIWLARLAITSLTFMLWLVPAPAWNGSTTNWSACLPSSTSWAARDDGAGELGVEQAQVAVDLGGGALDHRHAPDEGRVGLHAADGEVQHGALGLRAIAGAAGTCISPSESFSIRTPGVVSCSTESSSRQTGLHGQVRPLRFHAAA